LVVLGTYRYDLDIRPVSDSIELEVFSLRADNWKQIEVGSSLHYASSLGHITVGLFFNGSIHWLVNNYDTKRNVNYWYRWRWGPRCGCSLGVILTFPNNFIISTSLFNFFSNTVFIYIHASVRAHVVLLSQNKKLLSPKLKITFYIDYINKILLVLTLI
jgi:hypothetical protein